MTKRQRHSSKPKRSHALFSCQFLLLGYLLFCEESRLQQRISVSETEHIDKMHSPERQHTLTAENTG